MASKKKKTAARMAKDPLAFIQPTVDVEPAEASAVVAKTRGRPKTDRRTNLKSTQIGVPEGWIRYTLIIREDQLEYLKAASYWDRVKIKDVVEQAIEMHYKKNWPRIEKIKGAETPS